MIFGNFRGIRLVRDIFFGLALFTFILIAGGTKIFKDAFGLILFLIVILVIFTFFMSWSIYSCIIITIKVIAIGFLCSAIFASLGRILENMNNTRS